MAELGFTNEYYFEDDTLRKNKSSSLYNAEISVYEVFKVIMGIPLFFEDHLERLKNSLSLAHIYNYEISLVNLSNIIDQLCVKNNKFYGNIELRISKLTDNTAIALIGFIPHKYPETINYINGVNTAILNAERKNPNAKVKDTKTRLKANEFLKSRGVFEVLLENYANEITEGSRSNVFFIKEDKIHTASKKNVLPGITRKLAIKAIENLGIDILYKAVSSEELEQCDAAFLCGTSIGVLPVSCINNHSYSSNNGLLRQVMQEFNTLVSEYIQSKQ